MAREFGDEWDDVPGEFVVTHEPTPDEVVAQEAEAAEDEE